ncbi:MAG: P1 family peptidase [Eubacteriales bacterium]|nr:P1 family peptidase [Eubacteriales bacterium]
MGVNIDRWKFGILKKGPRNLITDVPGVKVGHTTISNDNNQTGVTAILPHGGNLFKSKVSAAMHVINGFGKSAGLIQVEELGTIETPIILTNTFGVGTGINAVVTYMLNENPEIGDTTGTVNSMVLECNDGVINNIRNRAVTEEDVLSAIEHACEDFEEGAVGGGRGMRCYGLKGGIGSASREVTIAGKTYTVGALLMTNFGRTGDLTVCGEPIGRKMLDEYKEERGSCIIILATDIPLSVDQLKRCTHRAQNGLARTGSFTSNGSGEIALMFSTANQIPHWDENPVEPIYRLHEDAIDDVFRAVTECVEESVVSSLYHAEPLKNREGKIVHSLKEYL